MAHDLVIKNGTVIDGTGSAAYSADVAIDGDKISAIGKNLGTGKKEIDAKGHVVAPGFIDSHTHMDAFVVQYPNGNPVVNYGVTSIVIGDCGASCAPVPPKPEPRQVLVQYLRRVLKQEQPAIDAWYHHWIIEGFTALETTIEPGPYCFGKEVTLADIYLVPQMYNARRFKTDLTPFPTLVGISTHLEALPAFAAARPEMQPDAQ